MIDRRTFLLFAFAATEGSAATPAPEIINIRFGVVREVSEGVFEFVQETTRIPRRFKASGFRFGIGFENPQCELIEWFEVVHLPAELKEVSGNFQRARAKTMRTKTFRSDRPTVIDDFWFDEGDPLGPHRIELFVNGALRYAIDFVVVEK